MASTRTIRADWIQCPECENRDAYLKKKTWSGEAPSFEWVCDECGASEHVHGV